MMDYHRVDSASAFSCVGEPPTLVLVGIGAQHIDHDPALETIWTFPDALCLKLSPSGRLNLPRDLKRYLVLK